MKPIPTVTKYKDNEGNLHESEAAAREANARNKLCEYIKDAVAIRGEVKVEDCIKNCHKWVQLYEEYLNE